MPLVKVSVVTLPAELSRPEFKLSVKSLSGPASTDSKFKLNLRLNIMPGLSRRLGAVSVPVTHWQPETVATSSSSKRLGFKHAWLHRLRVMCTASASDSDSDSDSESPAELEHSSTHTP